MFWRSRLLCSSGSVVTLLELFEPEDGGITNPSKCYEILPVTWCYIPELSPTTLLWEMQICFLFTAYGFLWIWFVEHPVGTFLLLRKYMFLWLGTVCCGGTRWRSWLRRCATSWKVTGSVPDGVIGIFHWHNPPSCTVALG
jgi:hypothetical protein